MDRILDFKTRGRRHVPVVSDYSKALLVAREPSPNALLMLLAENRLGRKVWERAIEVLVCRFGWQHQVAAELERLLDMAFIHLMARLQLFVERVNHSAWTALPIGDSRTLDADEQQSLLRRIFKRTMWDMGTPLFCRSGSEIATLFIKDETILADLVDCYDAVLLYQSRTEVFDDSINAWGLRNVDSQLNWCRRIRSALVTIQNPSHSELEREVESASKASVAEESDRHARQM